ncbi:DEAD/DEAH box helicase [Coleofasciculus chthonoplastes]|uniref:DEAD/DEAH box helicase n=1 Tax=Coleofasciculus chthonoplastes TaxID=64178 RepID=UPI0032F7DD7F
MAILHGSWITGESDSYLFIWGEQWRPLASVDSAANSDIFPHPFAMTQTELSEFLRDRGLTLPESGTGKSDRDTESAIASWQSQVFVLPTHPAGAKTPAYPILSAQLPTEDSSSLELHQWQVTGYRLTPSTALPFLQSLPLGGFNVADNYVGSDLRFWTHVYRWSLDLLTRCKFLPGLYRQPDGEAIAYWQPLLDSATDQTRLAEFTQSMPLACQAYDDVETRHGASLQSQHPQSLILNFLRHAIDTQVQNWVESLSPPTATSPIPEWLQALCSAKEKLDVEPMAIARLDTALSNWTTSIQQHLVTPTTQGLTQNLFRTCLVLQPPEPDEANWRLDFCLQAMDEADLLVDAKTIWRHPIEQLDYHGRTIEQPQETLLKGLGLASRLYPPLEASLHERCPRFCELNPVQVYEFIKASAWRLQDSGLGIILPPGLAPGSGEKRLGISITAEAPKSKKDERLGLQSLLKFKWDLAIGDTKLSKSEFQRLMSLKSPLVEVNGEWIALQPADARAAQTILTASKDDMSLSVEDAVRLATGDTKTLGKLPVVHFEASGALQELITNLTGNRTIEPIDVPQDFNGTLRPYQLRGASWLAFLERWGLGACLADDMGLGKTIQFIAFMLHLKEQDVLESPTLLVCPTSVLGNWEREVKKFAPTLKAIVHHGDKRSKGKTFAKAAKTKDLVITSYPLVYRDATTLESVSWQGVVLDEAQNIKNPGAKQSQAVRKLPTEFRIALTGTPVENRLSELWSILDFLNPQYLGDRQFFQRRFAMPIEKFGDRDSLQTLRSLVQPFILRRLKTDKTIIQDLPEKQEMTVFCGLAAEQATLYQKLVDESLVEIEAAEGIKRKGLILTLLMRLKQVCNHPAQLLKEKSLKDAKRSGKLLRLQEMLEEAISEGDRALIFTQFAEWGKLLKPYLAKQFDQEILFLYGATRKNQREEMIDRFQNDPEGPPILILSLKAGGTGLNLTRANHVFHIDRWWNPAVENQATDRAFRIGQTRNVQVHKFVCTGTLEERINDMIESKKQLAEQTVEAGENWVTDMDTDQLRSLLLLDRTAVIDE